MPSPITTEHQVIPQEKTSNLKKRGFRSLLSKQSTNVVLMVTPTHFGYNRETKDNQFCEIVGMHETMVVSEATKEHAGLVRMLREAGVQVHLFGHSPGTPDAVFPNNWFSTHSVKEGKETLLVLYPMKAPNRRLERSPEKISFLMNRLGCKQVVNLANCEQERTPPFLEGTGSFVLDRSNRIAYLALSERSNKDLAKEWVKRVDYNELITFNTADKQGKPIYHTNVMMSIGTDWAVVCSEAVSIKWQRDELLKLIRKNSSVVVDISLAQVNEFCGNIIEVQGKVGLIIVMSKRAHEAFTDEQKRLLLQKVDRFLVAPFDTVERVGGGGVRCAIGELF